MLVIRCCRITRSVSGRVHCVAKRTFSGHAGNHATFRRRYSSDVVGYFIDVMDSTLNLMR